ncbi:MAG: hypothetical protein ACFFDT_10680, partial [Candidatus Hodarchaeota archaeon]
YRLEVFCLSWQKCPTCVGKGTITRRARDATDEIVCNICGGRGEIYDAEGVYSEESDSTKIEKVELPSDYDIGSDLSDLAAITLTVVPADKESVGQEVTRLDKPSRDALGIDIGGRVRISHMTKGDAIELTVFPALKPFIGKEVLTMDAASREKIGVMKGEKVFLLPVPEEPEVTEESEDKE